MKRVMYIEDGLGKKKYVLRETYNDCGIYQHVTPTGFRVSQDYAITFGDETIMIQSYNNLCKEELLDAIDEYTEYGKFGFMTKRLYGVYVVHPMGNIEI